MEFYLLGDGSRILAQEPGNVFKRGTFIQGTFDVLAVIKGKMLLVAGNIFAHCFLLLLLSEGTYEHTTNV